ncbi:phosphatidylinositol-4,5-diphosphate 3-kinase [Pelomyxa schiedti]|nr:phosphatidylinositol-4,5-diphosphate 3-kinase [Pelomyxa schiedti]
MPPQFAPPMQAPPPPTPPNSLPTMAPPPPINTLPSTAPAPPSHGPPPFSAPSCPPPGSPPLGPPPTTPSFSLPPPPITVKPPPTDQQALARKQSFASLQPGTNNNNNDVERRQPRKSISSGRPVATPPTTNNFANDLQDILAGDFSTVGVLTGSGSIPPPSPSTQQATQSVMASIIRVTVEEKPPLGAATVVVKYEPDITVDQFRANVCRKKSADPQLYVVKTENNLICPVDTYIGELGPGTNLQLCFRKTVAEPDDNLVLSEKEFTKEQALSDHTQQQSVNDCLKIIVPQSDGVLNHFSYPPERTVQQVIESVLGDAHLDPSKVYVLGIRVLNVWLGPSYKTCVIKSLSFVKECNAIGINPSFEIVEQSVGTPETPMSVLESMASLIETEAHLELVGDSYKITLQKCKEEVNDVRGALSRARLTATTPNTWNTLSYEAKSVYILSEPAMQDPRKALIIDCHFPFMACKLACKADMPVSDLQKLVHSKFLKSKPTELVPKSIDDYVIKAYGKNEFLVPIGENGEPLILNMFDYVRRCAAKKVDLNISYVEKLVLPSPTKQDLDAGKIIDNLLAREVGQCLDNTGPIIHTSAISRAFKVKINAVWNMKLPTQIEEKLKNSPTLPVNIYTVAALYHGGSELAPPVFTPVSTYKEGSGFLGWSEFIPFNIAVRSLTKESRICFTVYYTQEVMGVTPTKIDTNRDIAIGWCGCHLFNHKLRMITGPRPYKLWEGSANPIGTCVENTVSPNPCILLVEYEAYIQPVVFSLPEATPPLTTSAESTTRLDATQFTMLRNVMRYDPLVTLNPEERALLWRTRETHKTKPRALAKILRSANWSDPSQVAEAHRFLKMCPPPHPNQALELLDAQYADEEVRRFAVDSLSGLTDGEVADYLLQLTQVLKYERSHDSFLARFLLERALHNKNRIGQMFYWCLKAEMHVNTISERYGILLEAFVRGCGTYREELLKQHNLLNELETTARLLKVTPKEVRLKVLRENLAKIVFPGPIQLPIDPRFAVQGLVLEKCKFMDSKKVPLWLVFVNAEQGAPPIYILFKEGDDLRQDILTLQMIRLMDSMWRKMDMDLRMQPYRCVATGDGVGMIEIVLNAATNANINKDAGGAVAIMNQDTMALWLRENNPAPTDYDKAVENFLLSCAGYCVATYVLGIGDRHADNVMITRNGMFFHIDFGHFLGNMKSKFGVKRERSPFKFTPQYAYILGGKDSPMFKLFEQTCCKAYNIVRDETDLFITLFSLMLSTGIPELQDREDIVYLRKALCVGADNLEAADRFVRKISQALSDKSQTLNDLAHGFAHRG